MGYYYKDKGGAMKRIVFLPILALIAVLSAVSCRQLFTTSLGTAFARDGVSISSSTPLDDLIDLAASGTSGDPEAAQAILDALGGKSTADIQALSVADQTEILNLATTASLDLGTVTDLLAQSGDSADTDQLVTDILGAFDSTVNLDAVLDVLTDPEAVAEAPIDSIVLASAVVLADVANTVGTQEVMDLLADNAAYIDDPVANPAPDLSALTAEQAAEIQTIFDVAAALDSRSDLDSATIGGFNIADLLNGTTTP